MAQFLDAGPLATWAAVHGPLPDDYLAVDVETAGLGEDDPVLQVGWCEVVGRRAVLEAALVIDWGAVLDAAGRDALATRLARTRAVMAAKDKQYPWTLDFLARHGVHPAAAGQRLAAVLRPDRWYAAHFGWKFDYRRLGHLMARCAPAHPFEPDVARMLDTGLLVKACQTGVHARHGESPVGYARRVLDAPFRGRNALEACVELFDLRAGGAGTKAAHESSYDSWLVHLILEQLRTRLDDHLARKKAAP